MAMKKATKKAAEKIRTAAKKVASKVTSKVAAAKKAAAKKAPAKKAKAQPIPKGYHIITPSIVVNGAKEAVEFYKKAFGAREVGKAMTTPDGKVLHGEFRIGDSIVMYSDEFPNMGSRSPLSVGGTSSSWPVKKVVPVWMLPKRRLVGAVSEAVLVTVVPLEASCTPST